MNGWINGWILRAFPCLFSHLSARFNRHTALPGRPTIWMIVGQGPTALAVGADGLKGPLNQKQPTDILLKRLRNQQILHSFSNMILTLLYTAKFKM